MIARALPLVLLASACFGPGAEPVRPSGATVIFGAPIPDSANRCTASVYIDSVAFGSTRGAASLVEYQPSNCGGPSGSAPDVPIMTFPIGGENPAGTMVGSVHVQADNSNVTPRVGMTDAGAIWAYNDNGGPTMKVDPGSQTANNDSGGFFSPAQVLVDGTTWYVAGWSPPAGVTAIVSPRYPCCGTPNNPSDMRTFARLPGPVTMPVTPLFACDTVYDCIVQNATALAYVAHDPNVLSDIVVHMFPKAGASANDEMTIEKIDLSGGATRPSGLAVSDLAVAWSTMAAYDQGSLPQPACKVWIHDFSTGQTHLVLQTTAFSCMGLALDGTTAYFAIVDGASTCESCLEVRGHGIGRVDLGGVFESISTGTPGPGAGPRRVFLQGDHLYAVDPFAIAAIAKTALDGAKDFTP